MAVLIAVSYFTRCGRILLAPRRTKQTVERIYFNAFKRIAARKIPTIDLPSRISPLCAMRNASLSGFQ
jgi:hypothetical protein